MTQRRYGPILDAGTAIVEKDSEKTIVPAALGSVAYSGFLERGGVGELIAVTSKKDLLRKTGGYIPDSLLPDVCQDFWDHSKGAGVMFLYRVTDGTEVESYLALYDRKSPRNKVITVEAENGGRWGGKMDGVVCDLDAVPGDITAETTVKLPDLYVVAKDYWKGGTITFSETGTSYKITGNTAGDGTTGAVVTVESDSLMVTDFGAGTDDEVILEQSNVDEWGREKKLAVMVKDGVLNPTTEWGLEVYLDDELVKTWPNLSSDPNSKDYFVKLINDDPSNYYIKVTDHWVGGITASVRPANWYGVVADTEITATALDLLQSLCDVAQSGTGGPHTVTTFTAGARMVRDVQEIDYTTQWDLTSTDKQEHHVFTSPVPSGSAYAADNPLAIGFTLTETTPSSGDKITLTILPLVENEAIGGRIFYPDESGAPARGWKITSNDEDGVGITTGDLTLNGTVSGDINVRLEYKETLHGGYDGIAAADVNDWLGGYDVDDSPFNETQGQGYGLIKFATPGVTDALSSGDATTVEKAGVAYAEAKNHQYRYEIPKSITDEIDAKSHVHDTLGKNTYAKVIFPSYASVADPVLSGRTKDIPVTGMVHGWEAYTAKSYKGYHKAAAGLNIKLHRIKEIPTGTTRLNGEILNPAGLQRIEIKQGNFVVWGGRIPTLDSAYLFANHREQMSYYEQVLIDNFDWIIFAINDELEQAGLIATLQSFFLPEWRKRALQGQTLEEAADIKVDEENNTPATRASGDLNADITVWLADMVERLVISIGKRGVFDSVASA